MPKVVTRAEVRELMDAGAQVVDVLAQSEYDSEHLRGALHIPLKQFDRQGVRQLRADAPVVVYCYDSQ